MFRFQQGQEVIDQITGFKGIVTGLCAYMTGCKQALVQPPQQKNSFVEARWFDEDRLKATKKAPLTLSVENPGPDKPAPIR